MGWGGGGQVLVLSLAGLEQQLLDEPNSIYPRFINQELSGAPRPARCHYRTITDQIPQFITPVGECQPLLMTAGAELID